MTTTMDDDDDDNAITRPYVRHKSLLGKAELRKPYRRADGPTGGPADERFLFQNGIITEIYRNNRDLTKNKKLTTEGKIIGKNVSLIFDSRSNQGFSFTVFFSRDIE